MSRPAELTKNHRRVLENLNEEGPQEPPQLARTLGQDLGAVLLMLDTLRGQRYVAKELNPLRYRITRAGQLALR